MSRYEDGWEFDGRSDEYLRETFDLWRSYDEHTPHTWHDLFQSGCRAIVEECHARALELDTLGEVDNVLDPADPAWL